MDVEASFFVSPAYRDLMWPLVMRGDAVGQLNWATGIVGLDVDAAVWDDLENAEASERERAAIAFVHEEAHVFQIGTAGFPYSWVTEPSRKP